MKTGDVKGNWLRAIPLQLTPDMPCSSCAAYARCRGNCLKDQWLGSVKCDERCRRNVVEPICGLLRFVGEDIDRHDPQAWLPALPLPLRRQLTDCGAYEYVEITP